MAGAEEPMDLDLPVFGAKEFDGERRPEAATPLVKKFLSPSSRHCGLSLGGSPSMPF
ncbi:hypothetical protein HPP92_005633 [Vanilla planifolia]|uniref:Uncharacterized protein n=1 Tax=Vanilla planifolia TaxID=51239 RepID=A0A835RSI6_VANPL|nr:hypothetical protein HPP92_005633 [Vanilla planifolia]